MNSPHETLNSPLTLLEQTKATVLAHGFERIIHHLRGVQIGLALGGGAARGMAHLGVLKALEQHGIYIDMISGTSAGAMVGTLYAAGLDPDYIANCFKTDLLPSWIFRKLPGGSYWYLLYKYRLHQFESMLRKYLGEARLEQLTIPIFTGLSVDLVEGKSIVREAHDATISIPGKHQPSSAFAASHWIGPGDGRRRIALQCSCECAGRQGMQLCHRIQCDSKAGERFRRTPLHGASGRFFSTIQVIMRQTIVQNYNMNTVEVQPADW